MNEKEIEDIYENCWNGGKSIKQVIEIAIERGQNSQKEDELKWLETTFQDIRKVRTQVAGLSSFQMRIDNRIRMLNSELTKKIKSEMEK